MKIKVIAEIGSVHDGSFGNSKRLIDLAKECGADYVKFQYHIAKYESLKKALNPKYFNSLSFNDLKSLKLIKIPIKINM